MAHAPASADTSGTQRASRRKVARHARASCRCFPGLAASSLATAFRYVRSGCRSLRLSHLFAPASARQPGLIDNDDNSFARCLRAFLLPDSAQGIRVQSVIDR